MKGAAIWSSQVEIKSRTWSDWLAAHTSFMYPLHHAEGSITLTPTSLTLEGHHKSNAFIKLEVEITKAQLISATVGFDGVYTMGEERSLGMTYKPLIIHYRDVNGVEDVLYVGVDVSWTRFSNNQLWCNEINAWLG